MIFRTGQIMVRRRGINLIPTLIVGRGPEAALCIREMRARPELGYRVIGIIDDNASDRELRRATASKVCRSSAILQHAA